MRDWLDKLPEWLNVAITVFFIALALDITIFTLMLPFLLVAATASPLWFLTYTVFIPVGVGMWLFLFGDDGIL